MEYKIGGKIYGIVNNIKESGIYLTLDNSHFGFMPNKKMPSYLDSSQNFAGVVNDRILAIVESIRQDGMMILCDVEYWNYQKELREFREKCTPGNVVECDVIEVSGSSAVIKVGRYLRGYIKKEQIGWNVINKVSDVLYVGEPIHAVFIGEDNGELQFSLKYLQKEPYERALYDLSTDDLLSFLGHTGKRFIGKCRKRGQYYFFENLYSQNPGEIGRLLTDKIYGYNLKAVIVKHSASIIEDQFYAFDVELLNKEVRLERNQLFQFQATNIVPYKENPFSQDVLRSFKKNISPATNITASHLLAEIGKNMYSSKERMFFELIQNADDAASENGVTVIVRTEGEYLTFAHNGFSFDKSDFEAITSAANGTKKANENKTGYKGIGFKSVFTDSEEILILTGGYQFKYYKNHPNFQSFERFYFFVNELSTDEQKARFLDRFSSEYQSFQGVKDIPWQLEPIWVKAENFPRLKVFTTNPNVAIALRLGEDKIDEPKGYRWAIENVIDNPKFMLFLRKTNRIDFNERSASKEIKGNRVYLKNSFGDVKQEIFEQRDFAVSTSDQVFAEKGFDLKRKFEKEGDKILEAQFVNSRNLPFENIPSKLAITQETYVSFAVRVDVDGQKIIPDTSCTDISMFAFLPTLVKEFKFPFYINANFVLDPARQHIQSDNPWNCFLMGEIADLLTKWCAELCLRKEYNALNVLPKTFFNESETDISELAEAFNSRYKLVLEQTPFTLGADDKLHILSELILDQTGLSSIVGDSSFYRIIGTAKVLPSSQIDCGILKNAIYSNVEKVGLSKIIESPTAIREINNWYNLASDIDKDAFLTWLDKNKESLKEILPSLCLIKVDGVMTSGSEITKNASVVIINDTLKPIQSILKQIGFKCSEVVERCSGLSRFIPEVQGKDLVNEISTKEHIENLPLSDKLLLLNTLAKLPNVGNVSISSISLFKNADGIAKPLNQMVEYSDEAPVWMNPYMISKDEYCLELSPYLELGHKAFENLVLPNLLTISASISDIYNYFRWTDSQLSYKVIDILSQASKLDTYIDIVKDQDKDTRKYYIGKVSQIVLSAENNYSKESYEYKLLMMVIEDLDDPSVISSRVFYGDKCLAEFSVKDQVTCKYVFGSIAYSVDMSLSRLLPIYKDESGKIEEVKSLFSAPVAWNKLIKAEQKSPDWVETELNNLLNIPHACYSSWVTGQGNAQQFLFSVFRRRLSWPNVRGFTIKLEDESVEFINELMDFLYVNKLNISTSYFTCKIKDYFQNKIFNNEYISPDERLLNVIEKWADNDKKIEYLQTQGVLSDKCEQIIFRKSFITNTDYSSYDTLSAQDRSSSLDFFITSGIITWPVVGEHQKMCITKLLDFKETSLCKIYNFELLDKQAIEYSTEAYNNWKEEHYPEIFLFDGEMPVQIKHRNDDLILANYLSGTHCYDPVKKKLYVDLNQQIDDLMFDIARDNAIPFDLDDYKLLFREGMTSITVEEHEQNKQRIRDLETQLSEKDNLLSLYIQRYGNIQKDSGRITEIVEPTSVDAIIKKGEQQQLSREEKIDAQLEAQRFLMQSQPLWEFPENYAEADEEGFPYHHSTFEAFDENGNQMCVVLKSHKAQGAPLKIDTFEWKYISEKRARILIYTGNEIKEIDIIKLVSDQPTINISFSTDNLNVEERISSFAESLKYFKELYFDFSSFNLSNQAITLSGMYNENNRRQNNTSEIDL